MTYEDTLHATISKRAAIETLGEHGHTPSTLEYREFFADMGDRDEYNARAILNWLGY